MCYSKEETAEHVFQVDYRYSNYFELYTILYSLYCCDLKTLKF